MTKALLHLASNQLVISQLTTVSGFKQAYATVTGVIGSLQPLSAEKTNFYQGVMGKTYRLFADTDIDIGENDQLRDVDTGYMYKVVNGGVTNRTQGSMEYKEVIVVQVN